MSKIPSYQELEQKLTECELPKAEYKNLFDSLMVGIIISNQEGKIIEVNQSMTSLTGYTYEEILNLKAEDVYLDPEDRLKIVNGLIQKGFVKDYEVQLKNKKGKGYWASFTSKKIKYNGEEAFLTSISEINIRKNYEDGLKQIALEEPYLFGQKFFNSVVTKLCRILEADYTFIGELTQDKNSVRTISLCIDGVIADNFEYELLHSPCENVVGESICSYQKDVAALFPKDILLEDMGVQGYVGVPLFDKTNKPTGIMVALYRNPVKNIQFAESFLQLVASRTAAEMERTHTEKSLEESENRFRDISLSMADWIWEVDNEGHFVYISDNVEESFGYPAEHLIGKTIFEFRDKKEANRIKEVFFDILSKKDSFKNLENWVINKQGDMVCVLTSGIPVFDTNNNLIGYRGVNKDVTSQKKLEQEKEKAESELRQALKMEAVGTISGGIAHDFNNILGIIIGNTELAIDDIPEWNRARNNLEEIKTASLRARDVVSQLLTFSRKTEKEKKVIEIRPIIEESIKLLRSSIPTSIDIQVELLVNAKKIKADPTQIHQVLINLCTNAAHAMDKEGGILSIKISHIEIDEISVDQYNDLRPGPYVQLAISDTGHGINEAIKTKIFDPYFTTKEVGKGTGMGLSVVHGIIKSHNGSISVYSEPNKGSTFKVLFPLVDEKIEPENNKIMEIPGGNESILFIDDEKSLTRMGAQILTRLGYQVHEETDPRLALELFKSNPLKFDLIITDMTMPHLTGDLLAKEVLKLKPNIPIILCTGFSSKIDENKAKEIGIFSYVEKPLNKIELAKTIRDALKNK